jgi:hypothetical protein
MIALLGSSIAPSSSLSHPLSGGSDRFEAGGGAGDGGGVGGGGGAGGGAACVGG